MSGPRDQPERYGVPVNYETGRPLTDKQTQRLEAIRESLEMLFLAMHNAEGSIMPGEHQDHKWQSRRMSIAGTYLEIAMMMARRATLETP